MVEALNIHVKGIVQGVGFRPFVYRVAKKHLVNGWVLNAIDGVHVHAEAESNLLDAFVIALSEEAPAAAVVKEIDLAEVPVEGFTQFEIRFSDDESAAATTLVSPDLATCDDCRRELFDPENRRFRYPFINCTNCGPRFTIIEQLPYDRGNTSMGQFQMDDPCAHEYADPADRRFHAQPDACFTCGPHLNMAWKADGEVAAALEPLLQLAENDAAAGGRASGNGAAAGSTPGCGPTSGNDTSCAMANATAATGDEVPARNEAPETCAPAAARALNSWQREHDPLVRAGRTAQTGEAEAAGLHLVWGNSRAISDAILAYAVDLLAQGRILAVKGLGGYHLVCDGNNPQALATLRQRKRRDGKAFAVMMESADEARRLCQVSEIEQEQLMNPAHPIVLLRKKQDAHFAEGLADRLSELGVMLPYTPVQLLLMHDFAAAARAGAGRTKACGETADNPPLLVMTSGNLHDEPICISDGEAWRQLADVADAFMGNDRPILTRFDDSVLRVLILGEAGEAVQMIRRARGFAPRPLALAEAVVAPAVEPPLPEEAPDGGADGETAAPANQAADAPSPSSGTGVGPIFATGPEQKNTFAFLRGAEAFVSQHIGDMENAETYDSWLAAKDRFAHLFQLQPQLIACDAHPEYLTSKWAHEQPLAVVEVQHHHAHVVAAMAEAGLAEAVCGIAFDGTGYGADGAIWGGEVLLANLRDFERFANFAYVPMPGGAAAVKHPLRMAYGVLWAFDLLEHPAAARVLDALGEQARICDQMIEAGFNTPMTSSVGRLFDAASAILGVCPQPSYEGQGAIELEAVMELAGEDLPNAAARDYAHGESGREDDLLAKERYAITVEKNAATATSTAQDTSVLLLDAAGTFKALLDDLEAGVPVPVISRRFHDAFAGAVLTTAGLVQALYGINKVVLTGGVFMNRYLVEQCTMQLQEAGFTVVLNHELPPNDGCISLGQAIVATHRA